MKKQAASRVKVSVGSMSCSIFSSVETTCPMCLATVPAKTPHVCGNGTTKAFADAIVKALS